MRETKLKGQTPDIAEENIKKLKSIFPEVFCEDKIDFEKLQQVLGNYIETENERYNFTWNGKSQALRLSQTPSTGTLRPCKEESINWDTTQNLYIEGDNLEVLKLLQKSYHNKVKLIYIDPPYNTGKEFVYPDDYTDNIQNYLEITRQVDGEGNIISTNKETSGRYHTNWLNMMYPRLRLARNLLRPDGVIFISIDDNEVHNLRKICDEIFGEDNFIANIVWQKKYSPQNDATYFSDMHDHIIVYVKNKKQSKNDPVGWQRNLLPRSKGQNKRYSNPDNDPRGPWMSDNLTVKTYTPDNDYEIITPSGRIVNPSEGRCWALSKERFQELVDDNRIWFGVNKNNVPRLKRFLSEVQDGRVPVTWWTRKECGDNQEARRELINIMDNVDVVFDTPKPVRLIKKILQIATNEQDIIMDFFSGSATTAHAVMQLNAEDNGKRKFIMVQLPERLAKEEKNLDGVVLSTIADIGKERIRRAGEQIKQDLIEKQKGQLILDIDEQSAIDPDDLDLGFKVFKLDSSNIKKWNPDYDNLEQSLFDNIDNYVDGRTELDVVYEIMLKYGIDLTYPIEEYTIDDKRVYSIGLGALMICLDDEITEAIAEGIIKLKEELNPEIIRVVFKDNGFKNDCLKTNIKEMFKCAGIDEFVTL